MPGTRFDPPQQLDGARVERSARVSDLPPKATVTLSGIKSGPPVNRRDTVVTLLVLGVASGPLASFAQQQTTVPRIGVLISETPSVEAIRVEALRAGLRDHGYVEGRSIAIELRSADGVYGRLPAWQPSLLVSKLTCWWPLE